MSFDWAQIRNPTPKEFATLYGLPFNVRAWGAKGDGVTDDTAAIQACIDDASQSNSDLLIAAGFPDTGGTVYFPPGIYRCSGLTMTVNKVTLKGEQWVSVLKGLDTASSPILTTSNTRQRLEKLVFDGNRNGNNCVTTDGSGDTAWDLIIDNCFFYGSNARCYENINASNEFTTLRIYNCTFQGGDNGMVRISKPWSGCIRDSMFQAGGGDNGVTDAIEYGLGIFHDEAGSGSAGYQFLVDNNYFEWNAQEVGVTGGFAPEFGPQGGVHKCKRAIRTDTRNIRITGNRFTFNSSDDQQLEAILLEADSRACLVENNIFGDRRASAVDIRLESGSAKNLVRNNDGLTENVVIEDNATFQSNQVWESQQIVTRGFKVYDRTTTQIGDAANPVNTNLKFRGSIVYGIDTDLLYVANGSNATDTWSPSDGGTDITPS